MKVEHTFPLRDLASAALERLRGLNRYRISFEGYALVCLIAVAGFAAWHSGANLLYLIFAMLISVFIVHGLVVWLVLRQLEVRRRLPVHIHAAEETQVVLDVRNRRRLFSSYGLRIADHLARGQVLGVAFAVRVLPRATAHVVYRTVFPHRGKFSLRRIELTTRFPFGLVERGFSVIQPQEALVYPPMYRVDKLVKSLTAEFGEFDAPKKGEGSDYYGLREYAPGDPARSIHWRSSVRAQRLVVVERERDERRRLTLALMNVVTPEEKDNPEVAQAFEQAVSMAASLAGHFIRTGFDVQLATASGSTPHRSGQGHLYRILTLLATLEPVTRGRAVPPVHGGSSVINIAFRNSSLTGAGIATVDTREWRISDGAFVRNGSAP